MPARRLSATLWGMTPMSLPIATVLAREAVRRQFAVKVRAR